MENEINKESKFLKETKNLIKSKKKYLISFTTLMVLIFLGYSSFNIYKKNENEKIAEQFIQAGIYLSSENNIKSKKILREIVLKKNEFYSPLALNSIIENELEIDNSEILKLFSVIENMKIKNDQQDLVKLKKALFLMKLSKIKEANNLLQEIISSNSLWKDTAVHLIK